jgi:hypothetical protein
MKHKLGHWAWIQCVGLQLVSVPPGSLSASSGSTSTRRSARRWRRPASRATPACTPGDEGPLAAFELDLAGDEPGSPRRGCGCGRRVPPPPTARGALGEALSPDECPGGLRRGSWRRRPARPPSPGSSACRADGRSIPAILGLNRTLTASARSRASSASPARCPRSRRGAPPAARRPRGRRRPAGVSQAVFDEVLAALAEGVIATDARARAVRKRDRLADPAHARDGLRGQAARPGVLPRGPPERQSRATIPPTGPSRRAAPCPSSATRRSRWRAAESGAHRLDGARLLRPDAKPAASSSSSATPTR